MIRIGILGCGRIGQVHALGVKQIPSATLVAVADVDERAAGTCADRFGVDARTASEILDGKDIDAVVIATPSSTHFDLVHAAVVARKAIFCEKPIDLSSARVRACMEAVENVGVPFMTAFNQRFDPHFGELARRVHEGEIGDVETVTITSRDPAPPPLSYLKTSGGLFRDMMIHDFDLARFLLREDPVRVFATGSVLVEPSIAEVDDVDTAAVILTTKSGRICQISNSRRSTYGYDQRIEVHGSRGMLRVKNVHDSQVERATPSGFAMPVAQPFFLERFGAAYLAEMRYFVDTVSAGKMPQPDASDGLKAQLIADAATLSWQRGQPVDIAG
ncbi:inositol 2-dehydrogenase [Burkholderia cenocepacia]|uniref:inositol 2-dehydrogenase n=1 Tax=Burkholderia cenocepacia TaxID=95486 RepID=UPI002B24120A|nr:inositol 2-dehydrogenase [Burkholderia cenocepacia]MEB2500111.1 inositol 2-dehydrogenase [Burkholderia cenocepacia]MEB2557676.1 inositol 2-dehydrogenase [Burkholderia cenocepacia]